MSYPKIDPKERFHSHVPKLGHGCWGWVGAKDWDGYGVFQLAKRVAKKAHRQSYEWYVGMIPEGMQVLHHCDNPSCIRPSHLFLGTHADNKKDSASKGRLSGIYNPNSKYRKEHGKPEYPKPARQPAQVAPGGGGAQAGGGQPVQGPAAPAPGGGTGLVQEPGGAGPAGGPLGVEAPGGVRTTV